MNNNLLSKSQSEVFEADGHGKTKSPDGENLMKIWVNIRKDSEIPEFDAVKEVFWYAEGFSEQDKYTKIILNLVSEYGGMFVSDAIKLEEKDIFSMAGEEIHPQDRFPIAALRALKKALCDYFHKSGQKDRYLRATQKVVCTCRHVTDHEINEAISLGKNTLEALQKHTGAGGGCGRCIREVESYLGAIHKT
jgi:bacterioferritin-associated ferredoxin